MTSEMYVPAYRVVVKQLPVADKTPSGIVLDSPQALKRKQAGATVGTIVGVGAVAFTGKDYGPQDRDNFSVGTEVIYRRYAGQIYSENEDDVTATVFQIMNDTDVLMPVPKGKKLTLIDKE